MLSKFREHLNYNLPFLSNKKLLIAISGGVDSMVMLNLFLKLEYDVTIAHCNFNLRDKESNDDEEFIKQYAEKKHIKCYTTRFDTVSYADNNKVSIQIAARQLRYTWFYQLAKQHNLDYILTAHHLDDSIETFLINTTRGTGIEGLTGIPQQNNAIIRPLLPFTRDEITAYAKNDNIQWREDSSNASDKYMRNKIRHDIIPILKALNSSFSESFKSTIHHLQQVKSLAEDASVLIYKQVVTENEGQKVFSINELTRLPNYKAYLYQWLQPFGFTAWQDIYNLPTAQSGKQIITKHYRLLKDRDVLLLEPFTECDTSVYEINEQQEYIKSPLALRFEHDAKLTPSHNKNQLFVNKKLIKFPLFVRKWREGDYFYPLGMNGQKKKISKYFKDEKMSLSEKENTWLLCSDEDIIWIIGKRADNRFKVTDNTTQILKVAILKK